MNEVLLAMAAGFIVGVLFSFPRCRYRRRPSSPASWGSGVYLGALPTWILTRFFFKRLPALDFSGVRYL